MTKLKAKQNSPLEKGWSRAKLKNRANLVVAMTVKTIVIYGNHSVAKDHKQINIVYSKVIKLIVSLSCKLKISCRS